MKANLKPKANTTELALMKKLVDAGKLPSKFAIRLLTIINLANNKTEIEIADILNIRVSSVIRYAKRYNDGGIDSLLKTKHASPERNLFLRKLKTR
jgi:transposase